MIEKLKPEWDITEPNGTLPNPFRVMTVNKINEIVDVVNALIDGEFPEAQDRWGWWARDTHTSERRCG